MTRWGAGLCASLLAASVAHAQTPPVCPFKPDELTKVFGIHFAVGRVDSEHALGASQYRECIYDGGPFAVRVGTVVMGVDWATVGRFRDPPRTKLTAIANDPDMAWSVSGPADSLPVPIVRYQRKGIEVELRIGGGVYDPATRAAEVRDFQVKLLRLRRIP